MARIVTVYTNSPRREDWAARDFVPVDMSYIRWHRVSEALAQAGHEVAMAIPDAARDWGETSRWAPSCRRVCLADVDWSSYDVVKTLFHHGFETLAAHGGERHPFIISKLGSVVGPDDREGIYFYGERRRALYETQEKIAARARYVTLLSDGAIDLWRECFGDRPTVLRVPGATEEQLPALEKDPYGGATSKRCLFAGHIYDPSSQPEANAVLVTKLNTLGRHLLEGGIRLYLLGTGDVRRLEAGSVTYLGSATFEESWDYLRYADVGVVVAAGPFMQNNESSKIYHYLRAGLPVVSEAGFPNDHVVAESRLGFVVDNGDMRRLAAKVCAAAQQSWDKAHGMDYILAHHTWRRRVEVYQTVLEGARHDGRRPDHGAHASQNVS